MTWEVDPTQTTVEFAVGTFWGLHTVHGRFESFTGSYDERPHPAIELTIDADSLDTRNATRDKHLRAGGFFATDDHPQVRFTSTTVDAAGGHIRVAGELEAAGKAVPLEFPATLKRVGGAWRMEATTTVDQRALGMSSGPLGMIRRPVTLHVDAVLRGRD
jgi:polyisoprenoid-binding protein YceI